MNNNNNNNNKGITPVYHSGMRVTDQQMLQILKEESGAARSDIESSLAKGFRGMTGHVLLLLLLLLF